MKVSLITSVCNCEDFMADCIASVRLQDYPDLEHIIIDGASTDRTTSIIKSLMHPRLSHFVKPDKGFYDGLNKGLDVSEGDVVGIINADDRFADRQVISKVVNHFKGSAANLVHGNIYYTKRHDVDSVTRKWVSGDCTDFKLKLGWMPPHSALFFRRGEFLKNNPYSLEFGSSADYHFILSLIYKERYQTDHLNEFLVVMREGGMSNGSLRKYWISMVNDFKVLKAVGMPTPLMALIMKRLGKLNQFIA